MTPRSKRELKFFYGSPEAVERRAFAMHPGHVQGNVNPFEETNS